MPSRLVSHLADYIHAIFKDLAWVYSQPHEWARDQSRLLHELVHQGPRVVTLDLPALDKHFLKCLDQGLYEPSKLRYGAMRSIQIPRLFGDLYLQVFDKQGILRDAPSIDAILAIRQLQAGAKKLALTCEEWRTTNEVKDFIQVELETRKPSHSWSDDDFDVGLVDRAHLTDGLELRDQSQSELFEYPVHLGPSIRGALAIIQRTADIIASDLGDFDLEAPRDLPRHGPGVVSNQTRNAWKYAFPEWPNKLQATFPHDYYASPDLGEMWRQDVDERHWTHNESPSRLIVVPKTMKAPRLIAAEPVQHQWIQQLVWTQLEARVAKSVISRSVNFRSQEQNQHFATLGSIDGSYATIDLSAASDRLSCWLVERLFRSNWTLLRRLHACRTRYLHNRVRPHLGEFIHLRKFAPMGSACTFPVQTICYTSIAIGTILFLRGIRPSSKSIARIARSVRVFGDDIVVPSDTCEYLCTVLSYLGLKVNTSKTFSKGFFRESCGVDMFKGQNVTPTYLLQTSSDVSPSTLASWVETGNNFHLKGFWSVSNWIYGLCSEFNHLIGLFGPGDGRFGHSSFSGSSLVHLRKRWASELQRDEYRMMNPYGSSKVINDLGSLHLLQYHTEAPPPEFIWRSGRRTGLVSSMRPGWFSLYHMPDNSDVKRLKRK